MNSARSYSVLLDARVASVPGVDGLLLKEKAGGKSLLSHSIDRFDEDERCTRILLLAVPAVCDWVQHDPLTFASGKLQLMPAGADPGAALAQSPDEAVVWHEALRPNWQPALVDGLLRSWVAGSGVLPGAPVSGLLMRSGEQSGASSAAPTAVQDVFGGKRAAADPLHGVAELIPADGGYLAVETPQVYDRAVLQAALVDNPALPPAVAARQAGMPLRAFPARPHNFAINDSDTLHLLRRLLGEAKKGGKDKYGGLGW